MEEKDYNELKAKFSLPNYNELNNEFELDSIEDTKFFLREIRKKIGEKLDDFVKILENILQPDTLIVDLHEIKEFNDAEKEELFETFKKIMMLKREINLAEIQCEDNKDAEVINNAWNEYKAIKTQMIKTTEKLAESWKKETHVKEETGYLG